MNKSKNSLVLVALIATTVLVGLPRNKLFSLVSLNKEISEDNAEFQPSNKKVIKLQSYSKNSTFSAELPSVPVDQINRLVFGVSLTGSGTDLVSDYFNRNLVAQSLTKYVKETNPGKIDNSLIFVSQKQFKEEGKHYNKIFEVKEDGSVAEILASDGSPLFDLIPEQFVFNGDMHKKNVLFRLQALLNKNKNSLEDLKADLLPFLELTPVVRLDSVKPSNSGTMAQFTLLKNIEPASSNVALEDLMISYGLRSQDHKNSPFVTQHPAQQESTEPEQVKWLGSLITARENSGYPGQTEVTVNS